MIKSWPEDAWADYLWWQGQDRKMLERRDVERDPFTCIGKPEPLRGYLSGMWSRKIDAANRLVYGAADNMMTIYFAKDHY